MRHRAQTLGMAAVTRRVQSFRRHAYELQTSTGTVLAGHATIDALLRNLDAKQNVRIVRTADSVVVWSKK